MKPSAVSTIVGSPCFRLNSGCCELLRHALGACAARDQRRAADRDAGHRGGIGERLPALHRGQQLRRRLLLRMALRIVRPVRRNLFLHVVERLHRRRRDVLDAERVVGGTAGRWRLHLDQPWRIALLRLERRLDQRGLQFGRAGDRRRRAVRRCSPGIQRPGDADQSEVVGISSRLVPLPSTLSTLLARSYIRSAALAASTSARSVSFTASNCDRCRASPW